MTDKQTRRLAAFGRIDNFGELHAADFAAGGKPAEFLATIRQAAKTAESGGTEQESSDGDKRAGTETKAELYDDLYDDLQEINRVAKSMADDVPGLEEKFRMPRSPGYAAVLTSARAFLKDATPLAAQFIAWELPEDFLTDLEDDIKAFDKAEDDQGDGLIQRVGATTGIAQALAAGTRALMRLDPLMKNKYRNNPAKLAAWQTASHIERAPRRAKKPVAAA